MTLTEFANNYGSFALEATRIYGVQADIILAVSSWESAYGTSYSAKNDNNFFGIKTGVKSPHWTTGKGRATSDGGAYRVYSSAKDSFLDFAWLLTHASRYNGLKELSSSPTQFAEKFIRSGYMGGTEAQKQNYKSAIINRSSEFKKALPLLPQPDKNGSILAGSLGLLVLSFLFFNRS